MKIWLKMPHRGKLFIILSFIELNQPNLAKLCRLRMRINPVNFVRIVQGTHPLGAIIQVKFQFLSFEGRKPTPWADQGEICQILPWSVQVPKICTWVKTIPAGMRFVHPAVKNMKYTDQHTCEYCWHECTEHEEQHAEEEAASIVVCLAWLIANAKIQQTNEKSNTQMWHQTKTCQRLQTMTKMMC